MNQLFYNISVMEMYIKIRDKKKLWHYHPAPLENAAGLHTEFDCVNC